MPAGEFEAFARSLGLRPRTVAPDGKWRRCPTEDHPKKRNGAYKLNPDGKIGFVQNWGTMDKAATWKANGTTRVDEFDLRAFREAQERAEREKAARSEAARQFYAKAAPLRSGHPYLEKHSLDVSGCYGLKVDAKGWLVIPAYRRGVLTSLQRISPEGEKLFWKGAPISGTEYEIKRRAPGLTVVCEGLATGLACWMADEQARVIVAWDAGNLAAWEPSGPQGMVVIAADNDHATEQRIGENPGVKAGTKLADRLHCGVAAPRGIEGTDWCDYLIERSRARPRASVFAEIRSELRRNARLH